jgi:hypothetical protein
VVVAEKLFDLNIGGREETPTTQELLDKFALEGFNAITEFMSDYLSVISAK